MEFDVPKPQQPRKVGNFMKAIAGDNDGDSVEGTVALVKNVSYVDAVYLRIGGPLGKGCPEDNDNNCVWHRLWLGGRFANGVILFLFFAMLASCSRVMPFSVRRKPVM